ncbi:uncharacterized protein [Linepithema humile]|uniref:uncharacterized protein n=1 Tax=Linepithema humile TaxID=83485 RepID=UPI00351EC626
MSVFQYIFPNEILEIIFNFCDVHTLSQISMVCKQFNNVAKYILKKKSERLLVTNQKSGKFRERCKPLLSLDKNSKFITNYNWINKGYKRRQIYEVKKGYNKHVYNNKCVQMTKNTVWFCGNRDLLAYNRAENGTIEKDKMILDVGYFIKAFALCDNYIISGDINGDICRWEIEDNQNGVLFKPLKIHNIFYEIEQINATSQLIITGSENSINILKYTDDRKGCTKENEIFCENNESKITSISFDPIGTKFAASSINYNDDYIMSSFLIHDIDKSYQVINKKCDDYCQQLLWEDPHTILICFEYSIKKMDMRTSKFVRTWDSSKYVRSFCCSSDNVYTFMTGQYMGVLWDQRQSVAIQTYDVDNTGITSLEFDSAHMYAATEDGLYELDFTGKDHFDHKEIKQFFGNFY